MHLVIKQKKVMIEKSVEKNRDNRIIIKQNNEKENAKRNDKSVFTFDFVSCVLFDLNLP